MLAAKKEELKNHLSEDVTTSWYINGLRFTVYKRKCMYNDKGTMINYGEYIFTLKSPNNTHVYSLDIEELTEEILTRLTNRARAAIIEDVIKTAPGSNLKKVIESIKKEVK